MKDIEVRTLGACDYFGEISLIHDSVRTATVTTMNYCTLGKIGLEQVYEMCASFPFFKNALLNKMYGYDD